MGVNKRIFKYLLYNIQSDAVLWMEHTLSIASNMGVNERIFKYLLYNISSFLYLSLAIRSLKTKLKTPTFYSCLYFSFQLNVIPD